MKLKLCSAIGIIALVAPGVVPMAVPAASAVSCAVVERLSPGSVHPGVVCLEQRLIEFGYSGISGPDTTYDIGSAAAVMDFQSARGLYADGIVTSVTGRQLGLRGALAPAGAARVTVIGDSTSAAMRWYDEANNNSARYDVMADTYDLLWSVESCRRLVATSCTGRSDPGSGLKWTPVSVLPLMQSTLRGRLGEALVIMAGYDDVSIESAIEQIMAEATAQGVAKVFWLNYRYGGNGYPYSRYYAAHNAALEAAKVRFPNLVVLDWHGYSMSQSPATQADWFSSDQIHITSSGAFALAHYIRGRVDAEHVERCVASRAQTGALDGATGSPAAAVVAEADAGFVGMQPVRVLDTRVAGLGGSGGMMRAGGTVRVDLAGRLPAGASAAALNVTAVAPCGSGYLTVFSCGTRPDTSNVNFAAGRTTAALAIASVTDSAVCIFSFSKVDVVVDLIGAFAPGGALFHPLGPVRWVDTRGAAAVFATKGPIATGQGIDVPIAGRAGVPVDASAVWINLTATGSRVDTVWQAYPGPCSAPPLSSTVNVLANRSAATSSLVQLGANGGICVQAYQGGGEAIVDVSGWFGGSLPGGLALRSSAPTRVLDTRSAPMPAAQAVVALPAATVGVFNITAVTAGGTGYVSATPCGSAQVSSLLNTSPGETFANLGTVAPGAGGTVCFSPSVAAHLVVDQLGSFVATTVA